MDPSHFRIAGYSLAILLHGSNIWHITSRLGDTRDPIVRDFAMLQYRFFTVWTFILQLAYAVAGLMYEILTKTTNDEYRILKRVRAFREFIFQSLVWPCSMLTFSFFWLFNLYNKHLVFHPFVERMLTPYNNHVMHTAILPIVLWEMMFLPTSGKRNRHLETTMLGLFKAAYIIVLFKTYADTGMWVYPILSIINGSIYLPLIFVASSSVLAFWYHMQKPIKSVLYFDERIVRKLK